jgi:site-specific recombinase XerD
MAIKYLTKSQVDKLFTVITDVRDRAMLVLVYSYGLRRTELCNLTIDDIDIANNRIFIKALKNGISGSHYLTDACIAMIQDYLVIRKELNHTLPYLFLGKYKSVTRMDGKTVNRIFQKYALQIGLSKDISVHSLRHSLACGLLSSGADLGFVQSMLRHRAVASTVVYATIVDEAKIKMQKNMFENAEYLAKF